MLEKLSDEILLQRLEAILFAYVEPLKVERLVELLNLQSPLELEYLVALLNKKYENSQSGLLALRAADAYQLVIRPELSWLVKELVTKHEVRLSTASLETLAIIAYRQPITKTEIEDIRGVKIDKVLQTLLDYRLIKEAGRKQVVGKPILYTTTDDFLIKFGLNSLKDLPQIPADLFESQTV